MKDLIIAVLAITLLATLIGSPIYVAVVGTDRYTY